MFSQAVKRSQVIHDYDSHAFQPTVTLLRHTFLSEEQVAILLPSGLKRTQLMKLLCCSLLEWSILNGGP